MRETRSFHQQVVLGDDSRLNIPQLTELLANSRKRKAPTDLDDDRGTKRIRGPAGSSAEQSHQDAVPILRHTFEVQYSVQEPLQAGSISTSVTFWKQDDGVNVCGTNSGWLMDVPQDSHLLTACLTLQKARQVHLDGSLEFVPGNTPRDFTLLLAFEVSAALPALFDDIRPKTVRERTAIDEARRHVLGTAFLPEDATAHEEMNISAFYSILQPAPPLSFENVLQPEGLQATLLPFQRRSLAWLLEREGVGITSDGTALVTASPRPFSLWTEVHEGGHTWWYNRLTGELMDEEPELPVIHGGMLAEEPGLGKTVEIIALVMSNPAPPNWNPSLARWDASACMEAKAVKTTLIVTPVSLATQWKDELEKHAPTLKVLFYDGWTKLAVPFHAHRTSPLEEKERKAKGKAKAKPKAEDEAAATKRNLRAARKAAEEEKANEMTRGPDGKLLHWCDYVHQFDVVITTYNVLRSEIHVARPGPDRPRREDSAYSKDGRLRSPLVMVEWKRVVMDEVQMVGGGNAAEMVSLVPRLSSFAVSGTPAKSQVSDLINVLKFLRVDRLVGDLRMWQRLLTPAYTADFTALLQHYGIRTTKSSVTQELTIPGQTRYLVPIELGKVERHVYDRALEKILLDLGLDANGVAAVNDWTVDSALLRSSLRRLRGICTHPQVGQLLKKGDGLYRPGTLKTMSAVLDAMRDQGWKDVMDDWKAKIQLLIRIAQLQGQDDTAANHHGEARRTLELAEAECTKFLDEIKDTLAKHDVKGKQLKEEAAALRQQQQEAVDANTDGISTEKGKGRAQDDDDDDASESADGTQEDPEEAGLPKTPAGEEHRTKRRALVSRLREGRILLHRVNFLQGDVHHVLGNSDLEDAAYHAAETLRKLLLQGSEKEANKAVESIAKNAKLKKLSLSSMLIEVPFLEKGGIKSAEHIEDAHDIIENGLNAQAKLLWAWRTKIIEILSQPLSKTDSDADGQEYQKTLDDQGEAETYLQAYAALLADRREALTSERTLLAAHETREKRKRQTKAALKAVAADDQLEVNGDMNFQPEHEVLHKELSSLRKELVLDLEGKSIKSVTVALHSIYVNSPEKSAEKAITRMAVDDLRRLATEQHAIHDKLENDLALLRRSFNERVLYFRQLQEISDSVAEVEWDEETAAAALQFSMAEKKELDTKINTARARYRYLDNLAQNRDGGNMGEEETECVLCRCEFTRGYFTQCGHVYCEACMRLWLAKFKKSCPVCRVEISPETIQRFATNLDATKPPPQPIKGGGVAIQSTRPISYNVIDPAEFAEIERMETMGDFGSKVQTLVRHLAHIKLTDPSAKSIVFSAWEDSLHIVEQALRMNGIECLRIDNGAKQRTATHRFATDPDMSVLLLHGERENAGLNVTCASRVFLLESVVHHSFEIQAIARIDRLGQTRPTEVYCYYAEDTVERNILDLAARKGLSLYTKDNSHGTVSVSTFNEDMSQAIEASPKKKKNAQKGDFIYKVDDMLAILFPHMFEDIEYLLPEGDVQMEGTTDATIPNTPIVIPRTPVQNAQAGPSRLS